MRTCLLIAAAWLLASCAASPLDDDWVEPRPLARSLATWRPATLVESSPPDASVPLPRPDDPRETLTLRDAVALALLHSPELAAFAYDVRAAEARRVQAGLWPNPMIGVAGENLAGPSNADDRFVMATVRLSQVIELGGKRDKRMALAEAERRLAGWDYEARRLEVVTQAAQRHVAVVAAQQRVELAQRSLKLAEQTHAIVTQRVEAGAVPTSERDRSLVRVTTARIALNTATHQLSAARQALASTWGGTRAMFREAGGDLNAAAPVPAEDALLQVAADHPRLARWADEIEQRRRAVELARAQGVPDVTAGAGVRIFPDAGDAAAVFEFSVPLPLVDRNQGRVLEARYALARAIVQQRAAEAQLKQELSAAHADLAAAAFAVKSLQQQALPAADAAHKSAKDAFAAGRTDYLNVLDAERTLIEIEQQLIDARENQHRAAATLEGLTAQALGAGADGVTR